MQALQAEAVEVKDLRSLRQRLERLLSQAEEELRDLESAPAHKPTFWEQML